MRRYWNMCFEKDFRVGNSALIGPEEIVAKRYFYKFVFVVVCIVHLTRVLEVVKHHCADD